jgi:hypothetical protein
MLRETTAPGAESAPGAARFRHDAPAQTQQTGALPV